MKLSVLISIGLVLAFGLMGCEKKIKEAAASEEEDVARAMEQVEEVEIIESSRRIEEDITKKKTETITEFAVDENKPLFEIRAEAMAMDNASLETAAKSYKDLISVKRVELLDTTGKIEGLPYLDPFGRQTFSADADIIDLTESISALTERHRIYLDVLEMRGSDISGLQLD